MTCKTGLLAVGRAFVVALVALLLTACCFVQLQENLLCHRAERLLDDFQSIRLHQSTCADAQRLTTRWTAWGHSDGQCTPTSCDYTITLADSVTDAAWCDHWALAWW